MSELTEMEQYLQKLFTEAGNDLKKKFLKYTQDFQRLDAERQQAVEDGRMTEDEYKEWRKNKLLYGMHWQRLIDKDTKELLKYNETALRYINGETPQIFASGYNSVVEKVPDSPVGGYDFELVNADTVKNIVHEEGIILPKKKLDPEKDVAWNAKLINAQLLQGILQGESIPEMAKRMQTVANSDLAGATRTARTMHTAAQNCGRQTGYNKAAKQGIIFEKTWLAANQIGRTRDTHMELSGTTVPYDQRFKSSSGVKLMFPGDWNAEGGDVGSEIYNCRCTLITKFKGFKKLNGEESTNYTHEFGHEIPKEQEKTAAEKAAETVETIVKATTRAEAEEILYGANGIFTQPMYTSTRAMCDELMIVTANTLNALEQKFGILNKFAKIGNRKPTFMEKTAGIAACIIDVGSMSFTAKYFRKVDYHFKTMIHGRDTGQFMPFTDDNAYKYAFTHEYGHAIQGYYMRHILKRSDYDKAAKEIADEIFDIAKKINPSINAADHMSIYSQEDEMEFFAEAFANSQCGEPNILGEAMIEWLKLKGLMK